MLNNKLSDIKDRLISLEEEENKKLLLQISPEMNLTINPSINLSDLQQSILTSAQQRLWILAKFDRVPYLYHVPLILTLPSDVNIDYLQRAFNVLFELYPQLAVGFNEINGKVMQTYTSRIKLDWTQIELNEDLNDIVDLEYDAHLAQFFLQSFDLAKPPLFRVAIAKSSKTSYLCISCHHLIIDAWSVYLLLQKLNDLYTQLITDKMFIHHQPESYFNYVLWEQRQLNNNAYIADLNYWEKRLANHSWIIDIITDYSRPKYISGVGSNDIVTLSNQNYNDLISYAKHRKVTVNHVILSVYQLLLGRYSGQDDIYLGMPTAGRHQKLWQQTIGFFVNTMIHACKLDYSASFYEHLQNTKSSLIQDLSHIGVPYDYLLNHLYQKKLCRQGISFNIFYNYVQSSNCNEMQFKTLFCLLPISKFDLSLHVLAHNHDIKLIFEYSTDLFSKKSIRQISDDLQTFLITFIKNDMQPLSQLLWKLNKEI